MAGDVALEWDIDLGEGDIVFDAVSQDLTMDEGLETAVLISLFTDRLAKVDDILPDPQNNDRRGWWGDLASPYVEGDQIGSRLWLLEREKTVENVLNKAKGYAQEALQWMLEDGVAARVDVETERQHPGGDDRLAIGVKIYRMDGRVVTYKYDVQWNAQQLRG